MLPLNGGEGRGGWASVGGQGSKVRRLGIKELVTRSFMAHNGWGLGEYGDGVQLASWGLAQASFRNSCSVFCSTASTKSS